jgi:hypothetical protein
MIRWRGVLTGTGGRVGGITRRSRRGARYRGVAAVAAGACAVALLPGLAAAAPRAAAAPGFVGTAAPDVRGCDPIGTVACLLPFPDNYYTVPDRYTVTGIRVHFTQAMMPANSGGQRIDPAEWDRNDGFSPGTPILTVVPGISLARTGAAPQTDIGISLRRSAPIVVLDTNTGRRVPYWAELDSNTTDTARQALIIHPAIRLADDTHYVVALRDLRNAAGGLMPPPPGFAAMLQPRPPRNPVLRARWFSLRPVLRALHQNGIASAGLYQAWDFTTASSLSLTGRVLHMRNQAFARLGSRAPGVVITSVQNYTAQQNANITRIVAGYVDVPSYLNKPGGPPGSMLHYASAHPGPYAVPEQIPGNVQHALFECVIPRAALVAPGQAVLYGHGLFSNQTEVTTPDIEEVAQKYDITFCGAVWLGLASPDLAADVKVIQNLSLFPEIPDQMQQAYLDFLFLGRAIASSAGLARLAAFHGPDGQPLLTTKNRLLGYVGYSEGGIEGAALAALAQDFTRAVLGVPGMEYSLLLNRSVDFTPFEQLLNVSYPDKLEQQILLGLLQMLWDRGEGDGYADHITSDPLPGTPVKEVLMHEAFGDHQVANVSTELMARTLGVHIYQPALKPHRSLDVVPFWGIPAIPRFPFPGSALVVWDSGSPPAPPANIPPTKGHDPHSDPGNTPAAQEQAVLFLLTGEVFDTCGGLPCIGVRTSTTSG